jgi:L-threonylcarbamoyladenylate synthase
MRLENHIGHNLYIAMTMLPFQNDIDACLDILDKGGLILYPTDTIWGIGCDATNELAVEKIYRLKQRPDHKPMVVLMADEREILQYVTQPDLQVFDYIKGVSKPITVVYEGGVGLADQLLAEDRSVAIRITTDSFCKHLIKRFRKPIVSTSANLSGYPAPRSFQDIDPLIKEGVDYVVRYRQADDNYYKPSSVVRWDKNGELIIIRS